ncbi:hypothetical protein M514_02087 [Trichuris suis]|uniref:MORN repeat protein n=1 Tax=Trichuris suis TaxID=68888 RepID=A0A085N1L0_9BILA|nr:hypothetical protein M513_02087 [Trichuris suis]KFD63356.1 hypothetical protein M514_02087 [Trichuris suis]
MNGGRFDFDDGGTYCGGWEDGKAHGHGVCTGPKGQGEYSGAWHYGFEVSGVYAWPSGNTYEGQWQNGKRHGLGIERRGRWVYRGEWTQGYKGRYGVRHSTSSNARYTGTWANGLQDGYGTENYADGGTYQGQWLRGMRHGYGVRKSAPFSVAAKYRSRSHAHASLTSLRSNQDAEEEEDKDKRNQDENRGGFVLRARSEPPARRRSLSERSIAVKRTIFQGLRIKKQKSTGDIAQRITSATGSIRSSGSTVSWGSDESAWTGYSGSQEHESLMYLEFIDPNASEVYMGEWKNDKRSGFGVCERSDGLKYEGEWYNNKKFGYGVTTFKDGSKEEGKYKNNILLTSQRKKHLLFVRSSKLRERIDSAVAAANRAAQIAVQKADIALARTVTADDRAEQADLAAVQAQEDSDIARLCAKQFAPDFHQPGSLCDHTGRGTEILKKYRQDMVTSNYVGAQYPQPGRKASPHNRGQRSRSLFQSAPAQLLSQDVPSSMQNTPDTSGFTTMPHLPTYPTVSSVETVPEGVQASTTTTEQAGNKPEQPATQSGVKERPVDLAAPAASSAKPPNVQTIPNYVKQVGPAAAGPPSGPSALPDAGVKGSATLLAQPGSTDLAEQRQQTGSGEKSLRSLRPMEQTGSPPGISRAPSHSGSKHSLNQIMNDHFDQYTMAANPIAARLFEANLTRQQKRSPTGMEEMDLPSAKLYDRSSGASDTLVRRSTFTATKDWKRLLNVSSHRPHLFPSIVEATDRPLNSYGEEPSVSTSPLEEAFDRIGPESTMAKGKGISGRVDLLESRGSLPDLLDLDNSPLLLTREEIARLSSQRRQELLRDRKEAELIRRNPLRVFLLLFHPEVKAWLWRWKLPLFILLTNVALSLIFYFLLTNTKLDRNTS